MESDLKKYVIFGLILLLAFLSFLIVKPIGTPIVLGLLLAYILYPFYKRINNKIKSKNICAFIILAITILIIIIPAVITIAPLTTQILGAYQTLNELDIGKAVQSVFPGLFQSPIASAEILAALGNLKKFISDWIINSFSATLINVPEILFGIVVLLFTFFFALIEGDNFRNYFSVIFPFSKEYEKKVYERFEQVTDSVIHGHFLVGIIQGFVAGIGYFFLGIPNALLVTILTTIAGILPVIGPATIWIPVDLFLFLTGQVDLAIALLIYGIMVISPIDTLMRPFIVSRRAEMNSALALIGMVGGLYAFGIVGFVVGPLVIAGLILVIEIYKDKTSQTSIVFKKNNK